MHEKIDIIDFPCNKIATFVFIDVKFYIYILGYNQSICSASDFKYDTVAKCQIQHNTNHWIWLEKMICRACLKKNVHVNIEEY